MPADTPAPPPRDREGPLPLVRSRETMDGYFFDDGRAQAWRLLEGADLTVKEELVPPGSGERRHSHTFARQFFYVLEGEAVMDIADRTLVLKVGDGAHVAPKQAHRLRNVSDAPVRFLVVSSPRADGDRTPR